MACDTPTPAIPDKAPDMQAEVKRALRRPDDIAFIRSFGRFGTPGVNLHDFRLSIRWATPPVPVPDMTPAQRKAELGRQLKRLRGHTVEEESTS